MVDLLFRRFAYAYAAVAPRGLRRRLMAESRDLAWTEMECVTRASIERNDA